MISVMVFAQGGRIEYLIKCGSMEESDEIQSILNEKNPYTPFFIQYSKKTDRKLIKTLREKEKIKMMWVEEYGLGDPHVRVEVKRKAIKGICLGCSWINYFVEEDYYHQWIKNNEECPACGALTEHNFRRT